MVKTFDIFYSRLKEKVVNIISEQEVTEGSLCFEKMFGEVLKEMVLEDLDISRKQIIPRDKQNYPTKNILYRADSKKQLKKEDIGLK